ncbi:MAG: phosphoribosylglycinamide formyltransferase [Myxococcales bacterium]|nr:phosphoribosylglycinamide formyltransferase [Myxococcales bacterium]
MLELGVLVSGSGTNLQAILDAIGHGRLDARVRLVLSNKPGVAALERAERAGVPTRLLSHTEFATRQDYDQAMVEALRTAGVELVVLAGFMRLLTPEFLRAFPNRVINVHPALLPAFPGMHAQAAALAYGVRVSGCSVHFVDEGVDTGPIIAQRAVLVLDDDDEASLSARILEQEHALLVETLAWFAAGRVEVLPASAQSRARVRVRSA